MHTSEENGCSSAFTAMDFLPHIWANIARFLSPRDWARACCTNRAAYAERTVIACAQPISCGGSREEQEAQWALHSWANCQSLFLDTRSIDSEEGSANITSSAVADCSARMPQLHSLHIISENEVDCDTVEGFLFQCLHEHVQLLSVDAPTVKWFPAFQNLQHLVLCIWNDWEPVANEAFEDVNEHTFKAVSSLTSLRTLYAESYFVRVFTPVDLTPCVHLRHISLKKVKLSGDVALPAGCKLHVEEDADALFYIERGVAPFVNALLMRRCMYNGTLTPESAAERLLRLSVQLPNLAELRLTLGRECFPDRADEAQPVQTLQLRISADMTPGLTLVDLEVHSGVALHLEGLQRLQTLVLEVEGPLELTLAGMPELKSTLKQLYMTSRAPLSDGVRAFLREAWGWAGADEADWLLGEKSVWLMQLPRDFQPNLLGGEHFHDDPPRGCRCGACLPCLSRAGVPIRCYQGWRPSGFERLLAPLC